MKNLLSVKEKRRIEEMQKYLPVVLFITTLISLVVYPEITPSMGIITLLFSLALSTYIIYTKHKGTEHVRAKTLKYLVLFVPESW